MLESVDNQAPGRVDHLEIAAVLVDVVSFLDLIFTGKANATNRDQNKRSLCRFRKCRKYRCACRRFRLFRRSTNRTEFAAMALEQRRPVDVMKTADGRRRVVTLLGQIEGGVYV
jgi:uncharacterized protein (DUF2384 family)